MHYIQSLWSHMILLCEEQTSFAENLDLAWAQFFQSNQKYIHGTHFKKKGF